jgi:hypothetical protein
MDSSSRGWEGVGLVHVTTLEEILTDVQMDLRIGYVICWAISRRNVDLELFILCIMLVIISVHQHIHTLCKITSNS